MCSSRYRHQYPWIVTCCKIPAMYYHQCGLAISTRAIFFMAWCIACNPTKQAGIFCNVRVRAGCLWTWLSSNGRRIVNMLCRWYSQGVDDPRWQQVSVNCLQHQQQARWMPHVWHQSFQWIARVWDNQPEFFTSLDTKHVWIEHWAWRSCCFKLRVPTINTNKQIPLNCKNPRSLLLADLYFFDIKDANTIARHMHVSISILGLRSQLTCSMQMIKRIGRLTLK